MSLEVLRKLSKNEAVGDIDNALQSLLSVKIEDIKKDSCKGCILSVLKRVRMISYGDKPLTNTSEEYINNYSLMEIYLQSKEIAVKNRKKLIQGFVEMCDLFNLSVSDSEGTYFMLLMYYFSMKLNDTQPMIPGLFKLMLSVSDLRVWNEEYVKILLDSSTNWIEPTNCGNTYEEKLTYCSLNNVGYDGIMTIPKKTLYVSTSTKPYVSFVKNLIYSSLFPERFNVIVFQ